MISPKKGGYTIIHTVTQDRLIHEIAAAEEMETAVVRNVFKCAERIITDYLSSTTAADSYRIKLLNGLHLESGYAPKRNISKGMFQDYCCEEKIVLCSNLTKYYKQKVNTPRSFSERSIKNQIDYGRKM